MGLEKSHQTIGQYLKEPQGRPEGFSTFTEQEKLGLDKPQYEIIYRGESLKVSRIVNYFFEEEKAAPVLFSHFGLNGDVYDKKKNPEGMFAQKAPTEKGTQSAFRGGFLRLAGQRVDEIHNFFGFNTNSDRSIFSPAFERKVQLYDTMRETYAFQHLKEFPGIADLLQKIQSQTRFIIEAGLSPYDLFKPERTPPVFDWRATVSRRQAHTHKKAKPLLLEEALRLISGALSGTKTIKDLHRENLRSRSKSVIHAFLLSSQEETSLSPLLSHTVREKLAIREKLKKKG